MLALIAISVQSCCDALIFHPIQTEERTWVLLSRQALELNRLRLLAIHAGCRFPRRYTFITPEINDGSGGQQPINHKVKIAIQNGPLGLYGWPCTAPLSGKVIINSRVMPKRGDKACQEFAYSSDSVFMWLQLASFQVKSACRDLRVSTNQQQPGHRWTKMSSSKCLTTCHLKRCRPSVPLSQAYLD